MFPCSRFLNSSSFFSRSVVGKYLSRNRVVNPCHVIPSRFTVSFLSCHHWSASLSSWWDASRIRSSSFVILIVFKIFSVFSYPIFRRKRVHSSIELWWFVSHELFH